MIEGFVDRVEPKTTAPAALPYPSPTSPSSHSRAGDREHRGPAPLALDRAIPAARRRTTNTDPTTDQQGPTDSPGSTWFDLVQRTLNVHSLARRVLV